MKAVILATGPSLSRLPELPKCDISIAIKRAALAFKCDWWACIDWPTFCECRDSVLGKPRVLTARKIVDGWRVLTSDWGMRQSMAVESLGLTVTDFTAVASLHLAAHLGAKTIDIYGADWSTGYFDGHESPDVQHNAQRWDRERCAWDKACSVLAEKGVSVSRVQANR